MRYEYGTSPRKYQQEYVPTQKKRKKKVVPKKSNRIEKKEEKKLNKNIVFLVVVFILPSILTSLIASKIDVVQTDISKMKAKIESITKENTELDFELQKAFSLTNIEKQAKEKLNMQKLSNSQIRYVNINKEDRVEPVISSVIKEREQTFFEKVISFLKGN